MSRTTSINALAIIIALAASMAGGWRERSAVVRDREADTRASIEPAQRIVSASTVADQLLLELCAPERVIAVTAFSAEGRAAHRFRGFETIRTLDDLEAIIALRPDLVIAHNVGDPRRVARLEAASIRVEDLGGLEGRATLGEDARQIGALCGAPEAGQRWARSFERRMDAVARDIVVEARPRAMYLSVYADRFLGGTSGTSYHDVIVAAGLVDAAAEAYRAWPTYDVEQILSLDPSVIVTRRGMARTICGHPTLRRLSACPDGMVEVDPDLLDDPGPGMLEAAEEIRAAVHD